MDHRWIHVISCLIVLNLSGIGHAQDDRHRLSEGDSVERSIGGDAAHSYTLRLKSETFMFASVEQKGIDIIIKVYDPEGKLLTEVDSPIGSQGTEQISLITTRSGLYRIEIQPFEDDLKSGKYRLLIDRIEPAASTTEGKIDQIFTPWDRPGSPGAAIAVVKDGRIVFKKGYGEANLEYDIPITPSTVFHIASVSKQFTAYSITALAQKGLLSLDDDIRKYVSEIPDLGKTITIRHLIHHMSGLRDQWNLLVMAGWRMDDVITKEQILRLIKHQKALNFDPGAEYLYCNTGYTLLAEIVARVTKKSFPEWTTENIFRPLGMKHTLFYDDHERIVPNRAYSYSPSNDSPFSFKKSVLNYANVGATSLFTTAEDLCLWALNFEDPTVGDTDLFELMETRGVLNKGDTIACAFGQFVGTHKGLKTISHGGADAGYRTYLGRFPEQRTAVVVLSNLGSFNTAEMGLRIADLYLDSAKTEEPSEEETEKKTDAFTVEENILKQFTGDYELQPGFIISVFLEGDRFMAKATGQTSIQLYPKSETEFFIREVEASFTFLRNDDGLVHRLILNQGGQKLQAERMKSFSLDEINLENYTGVYYSEELGTTYTIVLEDTVLTVNHMRHERFHLQPQRKDVFSSDAWYFAQVHFQRDSEDRIEGCLVSNGRVRNLWFKKRSRSE